MPEMRSSEGHLLILSYEEQPAGIECGLYLQSAGIGCGLYLQPAGIGCGLYLQPAGIMNMWVFSR